MKKCRFLLLILLLLAVFAPVSCKSAPPPEPAVVDPDKLPPEQDVLDELEAAMARAAAAREAALEVQGNEYFPDEWKKAETDHEAGKKTKRDTRGEAKQAIALFTSAAETYEEIAENSGPLFAKDQEEARRALEAAMARAARSRKDAMDNKGAEYFPDEWQAAEDTLQSGEDAKKDTLSEMRAAAVLYVAAADEYDEIANNSRPLFAKEREEAERVRQEAMAREKDDAQKALNDAMARAEKARQSAMDVNGQTYFPSEWRSAESKNTSGKSARKNTADEIRAATALFVAAANEYDDITKKSGPRFSKDKDDAQKALNAAIARADRSRKAASDAKGQTNFPNDWKNAEARNQTARNAKRSTLAEIKAAAPLYNAAADAYDAIAGKSNDTAAVAARTRADRERQSAIDVKANIAMKDDFNKADALHQQAVKDFNAKLFPAAADKYGQAAAQFTAVTKATETKRNQADTTIKRAASMSDESIALAVKAGQVMEENHE
ncbi:MAG: hypothetical protein FWD36_05425 [Treponema sp.]|nr:hypothetical protein [Treponema sp.]